MKYLALILLSLGVMGISFPASAQVYPGYEPQAPQLPRGGCGVRGGIVESCVNRALHMHGAVPANNYASGGTYVIHGAKCISAGATFGFHSARIEGSGQPEPTYGHYNNLQRRMLNRGNLVPYLNSVGAFTSLELTTLSAEQVSQLTGIPLCR